ncbi:MAG: chromosome segregation protein SMC [Lachnospiraceae bacterium]|nr:chromosome segregation protein SMC [Lachnospiraceae bacterium]
MYLKSIEVQGFKSFANKLRFEFHNGITGIVGPNGSGKSNVADAVRWVLGEQSAKQLRSSKMEDVIFAGTENRKPQGFAYVAITMDNSDHSLAIDYEEVTVARRVYRSGESEYLINGNTCRLKDVHELFYDTGIGKEGYSIIGQGQIDKILSGKPEDRRELFDEAVGIVKFKRRKNAAIKKLEDEKQNLIRIEDILTELEKQIGPLEKQSATAKEYLRLRDELKVYDINSFLAEYESVKAQLNDLEGKITIAENELSDAQKEYESSKARYEEVQEEIASLNETIDKLKNENSSNTLLREKLEGEIKLLKEQINSATSMEDNYNSQIEAVVSSIKSKEEEIVKLTADREALAKDLAEGEERQRVAIAKHEEITAEIAEKLEQIEDDKNEIIIILNQKSQVKERIQRYATILEQVTVRRAELNRKLIQFRSNESEKQEHIDKFKAEYDSIADQIADLEKEIKNTVSRLKDISVEKSTLERSRMDTQQRYHQTKSRLESMQNLAERYEGYGNSIKQVMELKERKSGIIGVVADIITTDKKYETAIETALGGSIQNIVTDNEATAKELIEHLKRNKMGRATFLPLDGITVKGNGIDSGVLNEKGVVGIASKLVHIDKKYESIAEFLLGRVVVADSIDNALSLARKFKYSLRIVTLDGELLNPGGSLTGGAFKHTSNLLGRKREIEELESKVTALDAELKDIEKKYVLNAETAGKLQTALEEYKNQLQDKKILETTAKMKLDRACDEQNALKSESADSVNECAELDKQKAEVDEQIAALNATLTQYEKRNQVLEERIDRLTAEAEKQKETEVVYGKDAESEKMAYSVLSQKDSFILENIYRVRNEKERLQVDIDELGEKKKDSLGDIKNKEKSIEDITRTIEAGLRLSTELSDKLAENEKHREELNALLKKVLEGREAAFEKTGILDKEMYRLVNAKEKAESSLENSINYMWEEYELTYNGALEFKDESLTNVSEMKKKASSLKNAIKALGAVNINAIEDYKEVSERYTFLNSQHEDLITAEKNLLEIIAELDEGMRKQFEEGFKDIKSEFDKAFKELFGGGKGTLELTEDEDILEAGIKIIAQPPGKKLQNMMQLSGGEKALTAIALLFAIQNLKPSPFCLLDEIEAALDENNVIRFAKYLNKLTKNTQFIVITHRRGTMSEADRLYGITMQEKGVSTLVSVNLIEDELDKQEQVKK